MTMEQQSPANTPAIDAIETIISKGRSSRSIGKPIDWHETARMADAHLLPDVLVSTGRTIIQEVPYGSVEAYIREAKHGAPDALANMRQIRRLFIIARDSIMLGVNGEPPTELDPLFALCRSLGKVADTNGADKKGVRSSLRSLESVPSIELDINELASKALLSSRIRYHLHTPELTSRSITKNASHTQYHSWRKDFRRIANAYTVHASHTRRPDDELFAVRGVALNNHYGHINDSIKP